MSERLRLAAEDPADLEVISAAMQDAILKVGDIAYDPRGRRLTLTVNRFRWEGARDERVRAALSFDSVLGVRSRRVRLDDPERVAAILAVEFSPDDEPPSGAIQIRLAGGGDIAAAVECIDGLLMDVSEPWAAKRPTHEGR